MRGSRLRVIGNLPYNISTPLLFHIAAAHEHIDDLHVMLQKEVIDRIAAAPGSESYGRLTVMLAPWFEAKHLFDVGPGAFTPAPRVWSAVARLTVRREPAFAVPPAFARTVSAAFSQRRKTLRNGLRALRRCGRIRRGGHRSRLAARDAHARGVRPAGGTGSRRPFIAAFIARIVGYHLAHMEQAPHKIRVEVDTSYLEEQSDPKERRYVFSYTITIRNEGSVPARLLTRHWIITDSNGKVQEVRGDGVVGEQPYLKPGQGFRYSSGAVLETPVGAMQGSYQMVGDDGEQFDAPIAAFRLAMPGLLH